MLPYIDSNTSDIIYKNNINLKLRNKKLNGKSFMGLSSVTALLI